MKIYSVELKNSLTSLKDSPVSKNFPQIAFFGRSNVGKSSFINSLLQNKKIARISSRPGKTALFHYFFINRSFFFVDLPGYGYAKVPLATRNHWKEQFQILLQKTEVKLLMHLMDIRHAPSQLDIHYHHLLQNGKIPYTIIATKSDSIPNNKRKQAILLLEKELQKEVFPYSIKEPSLRKEVWKGIQQVIFEK